MKLSDLIFESQILLEDTFEIRKTPNGRMWGVYNTTVTPNVLISSHKTKNQANIKADQLRNPTPPKPKDDSGKPSKADRNKSKTPKVPATPPKTANAGLTKGMFPSGQGKWTIVFPDGKGYVDITDERDANRLQKYIQDLESKGKSPKEITDEFTKNRGGFLAEADVSDKNVQKYKRSPISRTIKKLTINDFEKELDARKSISKFANNKIMRWTLTPAFNTLKKLASLKLGAIALGHIAVFFGTAMAVADIETEIEAATDEAKIAELQEEARILLGQAVIQMGLFIFAVLKDIKSIRSAVRYLTFPIRAALQGVGIAVGAVGGSVAGPAGTVGGAVAGAKGGRIVSILVSEGASFVLFAVLAMPAVQRFVAQLLQGYWLGDAFAYVGAGVEILLAAANDAVDGRFGTGFLADKLIVDQIKKEGPDGEYFSDSEWAKLVFGALLFPDGEKTKFVPYMPESKREDMMNALLLPDNTQQNADAAIDQKMNSDNAATQQPEETPVA
jgi:hypothetical protein